MCSLRTPRPKASSRLTPSAFPNSDLGVWKPTCSPGLRERTAPGKVETLALFQMPALHVFKASCMSQAVLKFLPDILGGGSSFRFPDCFEVLMEAYLAVSGPGCDLAPRPHSWIHSPTLCARSSQLVPLSPMFCPHPDTDGLLAYQPARISFYASLKQYPFNLNNSTLKQESYVIGRSRPMQIGSICHQSVAIVLKTSVIMSYFHCELILTKSEVYCAW